MNIKNLTTLLVFAVMVMCAFLACADSRGRHNDELFSNRWDAPDSVARSLMGNKLSELISNPKKVVILCWLPTVPTTRLTHSQYQ